MNFKKLAQSIFSVKNEGYHKVLRIFGFSFKFMTLKTVYKRIDAIEKHSNRILAYTQQLKMMMDNSLDITQCKKATGLLREVQITRAKALHIITNIFDKHKLNYWLDFGTLIGAVRHKGFIPWDDDIDIAMPRCDYEKAWEILKEELKDTELGITIGYQDRFFIKVVNSKRDFWFVDIFPYDFACDNGMAEDDFKDKLSNARSELWQKYSLETLKADLSFAWDTLKASVMEFYQKADICADIKINTKTNKMVRGIDSMTKYAKQSIHNIENIFPLKRVMWEDFEVSIPNDSIKYLSECDEGNYGDIMAFPNFNNLCLHKYARPVDDAEEELKRIGEKSEYLDDLMVKLKQR